MEPLKPRPLSPLALLLAIGAMGIDLSAVPPLRPSRPPAPPAPEWDEDAASDLRGSGPFAFTCRLCPHRRDYGTETGAKTAVVTHYEQAHGRRVRFS